MCVCVCVCVCVCLQANFARAAYFARAARMYTGNGVRAAGRARTPALDVLKKLNECLKKFIDCLTKINDSLKTIN